MSYLTDERKSAMPNPDKKIDPVILAAIADDDDETPEEKKAREEMLAELEGNEPEAEEVQEEESQDESEGEEPEPEEQDEEEPKEEAESEEEPEEEAKEEPEPKEQEKSRKERRQERQQSFIESIRKDDAKEQERREIPEYQPINYEEDKEFQPDELKEDRDRVGAVNYLKGVNETKYWAEQDQFWKELNNESKLVSYDPEINFLSERKPDGSPNENFNPDKAEEINEEYLLAVGFKRHPKLDDKGNPILDNNGNPVISHNTVERTDLSYEKFARRYIDRMKRWANEEADKKVDEVRKNLTTQRKNQSVRPTGGKRKSIGSLNQGDISNMSDEEFEKHEAEIDRQIESMLGL